MKIFEVENLSLSFSKQKVFENLSFFIEENKNYTIKGESGSGKTTLLNILMGFIKPDSGVTKFKDEKINGRNISQIRSVISWVPQDLNLNLESVRDLLFFPFNFKNNRNLKPVEDEIKSICDKFGLKNGILNKSLREISGGEKQRIVLASVILLKRKIIILDEPTASLDRESKRKIRDYLLTQKELTVISSSHDQEWIESSEQILDLDNL